MIGAPRGRGMVLGKFMPPHRGHLYLVDFARRYCDELTVVVGSLAAEPIPGSLRHAWMTELCPGARVVHLTDENPQYPHEHPQFWEIWQVSLRRVLPEPPDWVFASEPYGVKLAEVLGARFVPVDLSRQALRISGTAIRQAPMQHWDYLPDCVRSYYVRRVSVFGPESTGKTHLAERLAEHFQTVWVPEYARTLLELEGGEPRLEQMDVIVRGQIASEDALARQARRLLVSDTDPLATTLWSEELFGHCSEQLRYEASRRVYDLTVLCDVDVPWVADPVRYRPEGRRQFFERCRERLEEDGRRYIVVRGSWAERFEQARAAVQALLDDPIAQR